MTAGGKRGLHPELLTAVRIVDVLCVFPSILPYPGCHQAVINAEAEVGVIPLSQECRCWVSADSVCLSLTMQLSGVEGGGRLNAPVKKSIKELSETPYCY